MTIFKVHFQNLASIEEKEDQPGTSTVVPLRTEFSYDVQTVTLDSSKKVPAFPAGLKDTFFKNPTLPHVRT
jgi:hypothetical protein